MAQIENDPKDGWKAGEGYQWRMIHGPYQQRAQRDLPARSGLRKGRGRKAVRSCSTLLRLQKLTVPKITVKGFVRFETGEGMEKKNEDFAAEVAAQMAAAK